MNKIHIGISYTENFPRNIFNDFLSILDNKNLNIEIESREPAPMACYEWLVPTAIIIFIGKSYFNSFLQEMGKDHYQLLKKAFISLRGKLVGKNAPQVTIVSTAGKFSSNSKYSLVFSVIAESNDNFKFKLLIQSKVNEAEYEKIISSFIEFLDEYYSKSLNANTLNYIIERRFGKTVLCAYDFETSRLEFIDPRPKRTNK
jgi:hypothetical protein